MIFSLVACFEYFLEQGLFEIGQGQNHSGHDAGSVKYDIVPLRKSSWTPKI